jgi:hypothetical protein
MALGGQWSRSVLSALARRQHDTCVYDDRNGVGLGPSPRLALRKDVSKFETSILKATRIFHLIKTLLFSI